MSDFEREYKRLNAMQKQAVDTIDGPLLVIAGPGTGKTQLLSARVAQILQQTDTLPQNILCLTFTENGASNMRERLTRFIGQDAHNVTISTYHAFGGDLIKRFPEYFTETRLQDPIDELGRHQILAAIVDKMSYLNPLKQTRHHLGDLIATISEIKRALLTSERLREIAAENARFIQKGSEDIGRIFSGFTVMPRNIDKALSFFEQTLVALEALIPTVNRHGHFLPLATVAAESLKIAMEDAQTLGKTTPLTAWKNKWLVKDSENNFRLAGELENKRIHAIADVLDQYQKALDARGLYDFDDMIIRSIQSLKKNKDLKYTLQEQYLYILLDEFQDTNAAQLKLVELLSDNPVHEGRPNIMAVGDDDQAIYAFQGAQYSNMLDFHQMYRGVKVINLSENYRSHADILLAAQNIAEQIAERLHHQFDGMTKTLVASNPNLPGASIITRNEFLSDIAQYDWIAQRIHQLIKSGVEPKEIAVLAPKHRNLEPLVPYLNALDVPVRYEKRENILETPVIKQLLTMSRLVLALRDSNQKLANALWAEVLSFDFWQIPIDKIWQISWKVNDSRDDAYTWSKAVLDERETREAALLFLALAGKTETETLEIMLDFIIGSDEVATHQKDMPYVRSPLRAHYTSKAVRLKNPQLFYEALSHLKILREKLRDFQKTHDKALTLPDLIAFVEMYEAAEQQMINTSPYNQDANAVQIMTVFKAKGLEYEHVFLPCCSDDVWGSSSRSSSNKLTLPANLAPIRHAGATDDERLRILFVALTRAKYGLHMTSFTRNYSGKIIKRLKYLNEQEQSDGSFRSMILPPEVQVIQVDSHETPALEHIELDWRSRHADGISVTNLRTLLDDRLKSYKLSPTHLNAFTDIEYGGPMAFFYNTILRFPQAPTLAGQYGSAMHETMEWVQYQVDKTDKIPTIDQTVMEFTRIMKSKKLPEHHTLLEVERGEKALAAYLSQRSHIFKAGDKAEANFSREGVFIGDVHMSGKIDRMEIDHKEKEIIVVDYKTGKAYDRWKSESKLHKYCQQLYCYKLLIENSNTYRGYKVLEGRLEFLEPDHDNRILHLTVHFDDAELQRIRQLLQTMWQCVMTLNFPDIGNYSHNLKGTLEFEKSMLQNNPDTVNLISKR